MKIVVSVGGRFHAFNLAGELERQGRLRRLITSYPKFAVVPWGIPRGKIVSLPLKEIVSRLWWKLPSSWRERFNPDFWLCENFDKSAARNIPKDGDLFVGWSYFSLHALRQAKKLGMVTVLDHGGSHIQYQRDILKEEYERWGLPAPMADERPIRKEIQEYAEADYIVLPSKFAMRTFMEKGVPEKKLIYSPYGVDLSSFHPTPKTDDVFRVVYVGGMTLQKGVHYLIQAFTELNLPNSELLLVGAMHDEMKPFLAKCPKAKVVGVVPQAELHKYYSDSSVFVLYSVQDGFGMVIAQAMACGLPVIASENTGGPDIVRDGEDGFILPIRNVPALKEKIKYLYDNPEVRAQMGISAARRVTHGFTWADYGRRIAEEYGRVLHKS